MATKKSTAKQAEIDAKKDVNQLERLDIVYVPIDAIKPNEYNPNRQSDHEFELLCRSMREDGFTQPVIVHKETNEIVDGEHRWRAAQALGLKELPIVYVDMTAAQMKVATLRHNRARGSEDIDRAADVLRQLEDLGALGHAQDSLMLDDVETSRILADFTNTESAEGINAELDAIVEAGTTVDEETGVESRTHAAVEADRKRERELAKARTEEARAIARAEQASRFRLMLIFTGDEATRVRELLGKHHAARVLEACTWRAENPAA